jgi:hypothetical protein
MIVSGGAVVMVGTNTDVESISMELVIMAMPVPLDTVKVQMLDPQHVHGATSPLIS